MGSIRSVDLEDYWNEWKYLEELEEAPEDLQQQQEGEHEANWLRAAGFETLVQQLQEGKDVSEERLDEVLGTLSRAQQQAVRRRVYTLGHTARRHKHRHKHGGKKTDVRDLFPQVRSRSVTPDSLDSLSPSSSPSPPSPTEATKGRLSPHSQGYHSNSAGSLDALSEEENTPILAGPPSPRGVQVYRAPTDTTILRRVPTKGSRDYSGKDQLDIPRFTWSRPKTHYDFSGNFGIDPETRIEGLTYYQLGTLKATQQQREKRSGSDPVVDTIRNCNLSRVKSRSHLGLIESHATSHLEEGVMSDHELPDILLVADALGLTKIHDLGSADLQRIQSLALIEMTSLFDQYNISYSRRKPSKKKRKEDNNVFGVPLAMVLERDRKKDPYIKVPLLFKKIVTELEKRGFGEEGLLRVPGSSMKVDLLKQELDAHMYNSIEKVDASIMVASSHDLTALLKQFLRDLPEPLLTLDLVDAFCKVHEICDLTKQVQCLTMLIILLPVEARELLRYLLTFLGHVVDKESVNKMSLHNVGMIMAPNLLIPRKTRHMRKEDLSQQLEFAAATCTTMKMLIKYRKILWTIPSALIKQIRRDAEIYQQGRILKESNKPVFKMLSRKSKDLIIPIRVDEGLTERMIKVKAPQFSVSCAPCRIDQHTTAVDILRRFICEGKSMMGLAERASHVGGRGESRFQQRFPKDFDKPLMCWMLLTQDFMQSLFTHALYEIGGNICERRLRRNVNMMAALRENPNAEWIIRCLHPTNT